MKQMTHVIEGAIHTPPADGLNQDGVHEDPVPQRAHAIAGTMLEQHTTVPHHRMRYKLTQCQFVVPGEGYDPAAPAPGTYTWCQAMAVFALPYWSWGFTYAWTLDRSGQPRLASTQFQSSKRRDLRHPLTPAELLHFGSLAARGLTRKVQPNHRFVVADEPAPSHLARDAGRVAFPLPGTHRYGPIESPAPHPWFGYVQNYLLNVPLLAVHGSVTELRLLCATREAAPPGNNDWLRCSVALATTVQVGGRHPIELPDWLLRLLESGPMDGDDADGVLFTHCDGRLPKDRTGSLVRGSALAAAIGCIPLAPVCQPEF